MARYYIVTALEDGGWDGPHDEFDADGDKAANAYAEEHWDRIDWFVLNEHGVNINA